MIDKFESPEELLDFVIEECGDMVYNTDLPNLYLEIESNFDMERVYYAIKLLKEKFDIQIETLYISYEINEIEEGYLNKTNIEIFSARGDNLTSLPKLPKTLERLELFTSNGWNIFTISFLNPHTYSRFNPKNYILELELRSSTSHSPAGEIYQSSSREDILTYLQENAFSIKYEG